MTITEAREAIKDWMIEEFGLMCEEDTDGNALAYCQYDDGNLCLDEQWYVDLERKQLYCYIGDEVEITKTYDTFEALVADIDFDSLIGESDGYIHDNKAYFERRY